MMELPPAPQPKILYCRYCLFMRDLSIILEPNGVCKVCEKEGCR
jgi:hypothetical protein